MNWQNFLDRLADVASLTDWLAWFGAVTGLVGMVAGVVALTRSGRTKSLDLRIELRKQESATRALLDELPSLIDHANSSRTSIHIATGKFGSRDQNLWNLACEHDRVELAALREQLPEAGIDYRRLKSEELEAALAAVDELHIKAARLREKYLAAMSSDDKARDRIQTHHRASVHEIKA